MPPSTDDRVSRRRYQRELQARAEAENLLEKKSRELFIANQRLNEHARNLEETVKNRTAELRAALEQAEMEATVRSRFIATMSHEIRTPLGGMLGMIDLLAMGEDDPTKQDYLKSAKTAGLGLRNIVNDVLDFSKMEAGVFVFENDAVDIRALIESVILVNRSNLKGPDRSIETEIDQSVFSLFWGDATRIRQVISNLISNALRYSHDGPIRITAKMNFGRSEPRLRVEVEDQGVGIDPSQFGNLFKDFSQISNSLTSAAQGSGLGLAICKRIIEGCSGEIGVESELGEGSVFWFELPVRSATKAQNETVEEDTTKLQPSVLTGASILLAEDNEINQKLLVTYLECMGVAVDLAQNGEIAVKKFQPEKYDIVLMDVAMPTMDGLEAISHIRERWDDNDIPPVILLTAHVIDAIKDEADKLDVTAVLSKPIPYDELQRALEKVIVATSRSLNSNCLSPGLSEIRGDKPQCVTLMVEDAKKDLLDVFPPDQLEELVQKYVTDGHEFLSEIKRHFQLDRFNSVAERAHTLRGASSLLGFSEIEELAGDIERNATTISSKNLTIIIESIAHHLAEIQRTLN